MAAEQAREIVLAIRGEVEQAADVMLSAAERCLSDLSRARGGEAAAFDRIEETLCAILEACAFQDLTGQRLSKLEAIMDANSSGVIAGDPLLNGPALSGQGIDQAEADRLLKTTI